MSLLRPAVAVMNRLKYPQKFLLISLCFAAPLAVTLYFLLSELGDRIEFTRRETFGTRYLRPAVGLLRDAGEVRRFARGRSPGLAAALARVDEELKVLEAVDRELGASLRTEGRVAALRERFGSLRSDSPDPAFGEFQSAIRSLISHVGDTSNLILDPDLDTYYLMDSILLKLPEGQTLLARSVFQGEAAAVRAPLPPQERAELIMLMGLIESNAAESRKGIETAFANNPSGTLRPRLQRPFDVYVEAVRAYVLAFHQGIADPGALPPPGSARVIDLNLDVWRLVVAELDELMGARIALYENRRRIAWGSTLLLLGVVGYLWLGFYAAVMRTVSALEEASGRMLKDDPGAGVSLETRDELGRVTESFNAIAQRLRREWKQANEDNARARSAEAGLQESEERTRLILQSALDAVISIDGTGMITGWNPRAVAIFGWSREEALGRRLSDLIIPPAYRTAHEEGLRRYFATGHGPVLNQRLELAALRRDGSEFPVELAITPIRSPKGTTFSAFLRDITDRKRGEEELRGAKTAAEKASQAKSEFLASMSHELRTPLNSVIGFSTVLLKGKGSRLSDQDAVYLERILANGKNLLGLINTILDLSKIEAGKTELRISPIDLPGLVRETLAELEGRLVDRPVRLAFELPAGLPPFGTDRDKLKQVLINLVGNAIKFTEKGSVTVRVEPGPDGEAKRIEVVDTGVGIPADSLDRIFEAFQQAEGGMARKYEGTGLGLTISRSLCDLMGYRIRVESEVGKGSRFIVDLAPARGDTSKLAPPQPAKSADAVLLGRRLLVVDDDPDSIILLRQYASDCGCSVDEARSGAEALRIAAERKPDVITLDLMMPDMNGWEILRSLKSNPDLKRVPVVVVSIVGKENRGTVFGAADVLNKPVSREELCEVLRRTLRPGMRKVLVVDDDPAARAVSSAILSGEGLEVTEAGDGVDALRALQADAPDLVILDLMMPVMDGVTFLGRLRLDPRFAALPVVVVTAKELLADELRQLEAGVSAVLRKGEDLRADLGSVLRGLLGAPPRIPVRVKKLVADLVPGFLASRREELPVLRRAVDAADFAAVRTAAHNMKGVGAAYGFLPITEIGGRMESAAEARDAARIREELAALTDYLERLDVLSE